MHKNSKNLMILFAIAVLVSLTVGIVSAAPVTQNITYQGKLMDAAGNPLTGPLNIWFRLYSSFSGGSPLASNYQSQVQAINGLFTTPVTFDSSFFDGQALWLGVTVGNDAEMTPRQEIRPVPYALGLRPWVAGASFTTNQAGTLNSPLSGVNVSTLYDFNPGVTVMTTGAGSAGISSTTISNYSYGVSAVTSGDHSDALYAKTSGTESNGLEVSAYGPSSNAILAFSGGDSVNAVNAGTSGSGSPAVRAIASGPGSHGIDSFTTGKNSNGVNVTTSGDWSYGVSAETTGQQSNGFSANTHGPVSYGVVAYIEGPDSYGVYARTYSPGSHGVVGATDGTGSDGVYGITLSGNSIGVHAETFGDHSAGVDAFTAGKNSNGVNVTTSGFGSKGIYVSTSGQQAAAVHAIANGPQSNAIVGETSADGPAAVAGHAYGTGSWGVYAISDKWYGLYADTARSDQKYGIYTPDYLYAKGTQVPAADVAEYMQVASDVTPGTVLVIGKGGILQPSVKEYDTHVAGIVSTAPGVSLGTKETGNSGEALIAVAGKVPCKADASNGPIEEGDLLTTSNNPGYAMKAIDPKIGTVLGKAMGTLESGTGTIEVLVTLQ